MDDSSETQETLDGVIERLTFHAPDTGWTVARLAVAGRREPVPVVGSMLSPEVGESVRLFGSWQTHDVYGRQFKFERYQLVRPATAAGIRAYLAGGLVEGIGPKLAEALVKHFKDRTLDILDHQPGRLREVPGIGPTRARALQDAWARHQGIHRVMVFLHEHGVGSTLASRLWARYGDQSVEVLERHPYQLAREIRGIGFLTADRIARSVGISEEDPARVEAGLLHSLASANDYGHLYLPRPTLLQHAQKLLDLPDQVVEIGLERLVKSEEAVLESYGEEQAVWLPRFLNAEEEVAGRLRALTEITPAGTPTREQLGSWLGRRELMGETELSEEQAEAVLGALGTGVCVITGGPGTGKTTVTRALVDACQSLGRSVALASPTGRAAKRLEQLAGHPASTIHRLLAYDPYKHGFKHGPSEPLRAAVVIIDEASMLDVMLAKDVLRALRPGAQLVLIGDADQLPSVGPGNVMRDLVGSQAVPVYRLTRIYRQAEGSTIIRSAHLLNEGESPRFPTREEWVRNRSDCVLLEEEDVEAAAERVLRTVTDSLPRLGFKPHEIQVIAPLHRGPVGVSALNLRLQEALNPPGRGKPEVRRGDYTFRQADRVLQTVNNYDKGVYNGDIGVIVSIRPADRRLTVEYDLGPVEYDFGELDELDPAYALTVHKSQGSEYPAVVMVIHSTHYIMLQRNLLYTALTRAQRMACIVGNQRGVWRAISNVSERERFTRLAPRLRGELPSLQDSPA
ncbi:MAG: ATP-dependent RecD-like DNA helicase [Armatimonadia bacterium]